MIVTVDTDDLVTLTMLCDELGVMPATLSNWIARSASFPAPVLTIGTGPKPHRLYSRTAVLAWHGDRAGEARARAERRVEARRRAVEDAQRKLAQAERTASRLRLT